MSYSHKDTNQDIYINLISSSMHDDANNQYFMLVVLAKSIPASLYWHIWAHIYWYTDTCIIYLIGRTDAEAEAPILWAPDAKNWLIRKDPDAGKD